VQNFTPIGAEMAELNSFFEIPIGPHRNAMRARYKDRPEKSTNGVGVVTPLQYFTTFLTATVSLPIVTIIQAQHRPIC